MNFYRAGQRISAGTGFILRDFLVTNGHVYHCPTADEVLIRFHDSDPEDENDGLKIPYAELQKYLVVGAPENSYDYAVFTVPELADRNLYSFDFETAAPACLGREYAILGYPLDHRNLTVHRGIISSFYTKNSVSIIQLDASVNNGNSGGPLVDLTDGGVVGIVTRKNTGLTNVFAELKQTITGSIDLFEESANRTKVRMRIGGIDPNQTLADGQRQLLRLCQQIERSANTGIGYAFSIEHLANENIFQSPDD